MECGNKTARQQEIARASVVDVIDLMYLARSLVALRDEVTGHRVFIDEATIDKSVVYGFLDDNEVMPIRIAQSRLQPDNKEPSAKLSMTEYWELKTMMWE